MHLFPLMLGAVALACFAIETTGTRLKRSLVPLGLACLTGMLILHFMIRSNDLITMTINT